MPSTMNLRKEDFNLDQITAKHDLSKVITINHASNPLINLTKFRHLIVHPMNFKNPAISSESEEFPFRENSIQLNVKSAGITVNTSIDYRYLFQSRYWDHISSVSENLIHLFVEYSPGNVETAGSFSKLSKKMLKCDKLSRIDRFTAYMFPFADINRVELLSQFTTFIFIFDG
jgi:hypothetical protein